MFLRNNNLAWMNKNVSRDSTDFINNSPTVSVVTPSFQQGEFIEQTILSVLNQTYPNIEYIIMDGGSKDLTTEVIRKYEKFICYWTSEPDFGQADAINKGFAKANGEIICWLNSDDYYSHENVILNIVNQFKKINKSKSILFGDSVYQINNGCFFIKNKTTSLRRKFSIELCDFIVQPSSFWSKNAWEDIGELLIDHNYSFDWEWFIRAHRKGYQFIYFDENLSVYRIHGNHKSGSGGLKRINEIKNLYHKNVGKNIADIYYDLHSSAIKNYLRKMVKKSPKIIQYLYYQKYRNVIDFNTFQALIAM